MSTTVSGNIKDLGADAIANSFVRFWLRGTGGNQPRVNGTALIAPTQGGSFYFDFPADNTGAISGTLYSTRDSSGTGNGDIEVGGSETAVWYGMQAFFAGKPGPEVPIHAKQGATIDISNVTPLTTNPVVTAPTGDTTYARLDSGNQPFTGSILPQNSNTTQSIGSSAAPWQAVLRDASISKLNTVLTIDGTRYTKISDALGDLPTNGGIVVCPPGYRETINSTITLGSSSLGVITSTVLLVMQQDVILSCGITGGTTSMFSVHDGSGILGCGLGNLASRGGASVIQMNGGTSITNVIETADDPMGSIFLQGFIIDNANHLSTTISGDFIHLKNLNDYCIIRDVKGAYFPNKGIHVTATTGGIHTVGPIIIENCSFDGVDLTNAQPLFIESDGTGNINNVLVLGGYWIRPGGSKACIEINGNGGTTGAAQQVTLEGVYTESGANSSITGIKIADAHGVTVIGSAFEVTNGATGMTGLSISQSVSNATQSITIHNFRLNAGSSNTGISNSIKSETVLGSSGNVPFYYYQGGAGSQPASPWIANGTVDLGGFNSAGTGLLNLNGTAAYIMFPSQLSSQNFLVLNNAGANYAAMRCYNVSTSSRLDIGFAGTPTTAATPVLTVQDDLTALFAGTLEVTSSLTVDGATPTGSGSKLGIGNTTGFGNGSSGTAVTTTLKSTGSGPATPQTIVKYLEIDLGGTKFWVPLVQ